MEDAQVALSTRAADWLCTLTQRLININGLEGSGTKAEILRRMRSDWETQATIDPKAASCSVPLPAEQSAELPQILRRAVRL